MKLQFFSLLMGVLLISPCAHSSPTSPCKQISNIFSTDPQDNWNQLYNELPMLLDCKARSLDALGEGQLVKQVLEFLRNPQNQEKVKSALDGFISNIESNLNFKDPIKRMVLQRDLWAVYEASGPGINPEVEVVQKKLAQAILKLALGREKLESLSINYSNCLNYRASFNVDSPDQAYLPDGIFSGSGPWIPISYDGDVESPAPFHQKFVNGRSNFLVEFRHPSGKEAGLEYLKTVNLFPQPWVINPNRISAQGSRNSPVLWNTDIPQFADGSQVALLRKMVVIAADGSLFASNVVESLQIRLFEDVLNLKNPTKIARQSKQRFFEFRLSRPDLISGKCGLSFLDEPEEKPQYSSVHDLAEDSLNEGREAKLNSFRQRCSACHQGIGILTFNSYLGSLQANAASFGSLGAFQKLVRNINETSVSNNDFWSSQWKSKEYSYGYLRATLAALKESN